MTQLITKLLFWRAELSKIPGLNMGKQSRSEKLIKSHAASPILIGGGAIALVRFTLVNPVRRANAGTGVNPRYLVLRRRAAAPFAERTISPCSAICALR